MLTIHGSQHYLQVVLQPQVHIARIGMLWSVIGRFGHFPTLVYRASLTSRRMARRPAFRGRHRTVRAVRVLASAALHFTRSSAKERPRSFQLLPERVARPFGIGPPWSGHACFVLVKEIQADLGLLADPGRQCLSSCFIERPVNRNLETAQLGKFKGQFLAELASTYRC